MGKKSAFTLIEILVVATIIGLLAAGAAVSYSSLTKSARDARRKSDLEQIRAALEVYRSVNGSYPSTTSAWHGLCTTYNSGYSDTGASGYIPNLAPTYIAKLPHDPRESQSFSPCNNSANSCYLYKSDGVGYKLLAHCTPEQPITSSDPYFDSSRVYGAGAGAYVGSSWALQVSSGGTYAGW